MIKVRRNADGVEFADGDRVVRAITTAHDIRLTTSDGKAIELGALRSGVMTVMGVVAEAFSLRPGSDLSPVSRSLTQALADAAEQKGKRNVALESAVAAIYPTPLIYSAPFLDAQYVAQDALKFRACRIAIANAEDDFIDEDSVGTATRCVERLSKWRDLFSSKGKASRAVNTMLTDFGETLPSEALWGLRKVTLSRTRTGRKPIELLGWLGAIHGAEEHQKIIDVVERANDDEMQALLDGSLDRTVSRPFETRALAQFLANGDPTSNTLLQLLRSAGEALRVELTSTRGFPRPPIPLPAEDGIHFIDSAEGLRSEGERMHHCVARLAYDCRRGHAYVFHAVRDGSEGTIHVDRTGHVVEARGPFNRHSPAAQWAAEVLSAWGAGLWLGELDLDTLAWPHGLMHPARSRPLRSVRACHAAYLSLVARAPDRTTKLARWFRVVVRRAVEGEVGLFWHGDDHSRVHVIDRHGTSLGTSDGDIVRFMSIDMRGRMPIPGPERALPRPPIEPPQRMGLAFIASVGDIFPDEAVLLPRVEHALAGNCFLFRASFDGGHAVLVEVDRDGAVFLRGRNQAVQPEVDIALRNVRRWARAFWAVRIGLQRRCWSGDMRAPMGTEPLVSVEQCMLLYRSICDRTPDDDGKLADFLEKHVMDAVRGQAWLVLRDREQGLISVMDAKRRMIAST